MAFSVEPLLTVADLEACPDDTNRYELIGGELFVSRASRLRHQLVLQRLQVSLYNYLETNTIGVLAPGAGAIFSDHDAVTAHLVFVRSERWNEIVVNDKLAGAPDLVIEVLSPGKENRERDLLVKRQLYAKYGVEEYWVVDSENRSVLIFRLHAPMLEDVATLTGDDELTSPFFPGFQLKVKTIFNL